MATKSRITEREIEAMYEKAEARLVQERNDFFLPQILDYINTRRLVNLRPEYQRRLVWSKNKKSLFIESLLLNVPVPPVFLYEYDLNHYEVMDGQQRLNTIVEFYTNQLQLSGLERWKVLNGRTYQKCPPRIRSGLDRRRISATVLVAETSVSYENALNVRKEVFERLNTGGLHLNAQEIRNCIYAGEFNELLIELSRERSFTDIWGIPAYEDHALADGYVGETLATHPMYQRMADCELVLRFFAFRRPTKVRGSVKSILDRCMEDYQTATEAELEDLGSRFRTVIPLCKKLFGPRTFKVRDTKGKWRLSYPLYDAVAVAVDSLVSEQRDMLDNAEEIRIALRDSLDNPEVYELVVGRPNTATAIRARTRLVIDLLRQNI